MRPVFAYSYSCLMARLPAELSDKVRAISASIPDRYIFDDGSGEMGREDNPHVTILYGLHTEDPVEVQRKMASLPPIQMTVGQMCSFHGNGRNHVVVRLAVEGEDLIRANRYVTSSFKVTNKFPNYRPHVTVAYLKKMIDEPYYYQRFYNDSLKGMSVVFDTLEFSTPSGQKHEIRLGGNWKKAVAGEILSLAERIAHNG